MPSSLPGPVAAALEGPADGRRFTIDAAGIPWSALAWGDPDARPLLLVHGVTASARIWWRVGPAMAASGRRVLAVDLPGHGLTGHWTGHHRFRDNAADLAAWILAAGLAREDLQVVGHSWGAMTAAALPGAGIHPQTLVLLDPPAVAHAVIAQMVADPTDQPYRELSTAITRLAASNPTWSPGDVEAKAEALVQLDRDAARSVLLDNGDWDGGLVDIAVAVAAGVPTRLIRADPAIGGYLADDRLAPFEALLGPASITTLVGAPHAPQRTHPVETTAAILEALA